ACDRPRGRRRRAAAARLALRPLPVRRSPRRRAAPHRRARPRGAGRRPDDRARRPAVPRPRPARRRPGPAARPARPRTAGPATAVLDPKHPDGWLRRSASAAAPAWWLTGPLGRPPHFPDAVPGPQMAGGLACWPPDPALPPCRLPPEAAYVAFTSGTTGRPHAVLGSAEPVLRFLRWYPETFALTARDRFAVLAGLGHDPLLRELLLPLTFGATACL